MGRVGETRGKSGVGRSSVGKRDLARVVEYIVNGYGVRSVAVGKEGRRRESEEAIRTVMTLRGELGKLWKKMKVERELGRQ